MSPLSELRRVIEEIQIQIVKQFSIVFCWLFKKRYYWNSHWDLKSTNNIIMLHKYKLLNFLDRKNKNCFLLYSKSPSVSASSVLISVTCGTSFWLTMSGSSVHANITVSTPSSSMIDMSWSVSFRRSWPSRTPFMMLMSRFWLLSLGTTVWIPRSLNGRV